jgi:cystathionine beta-synthase
VLDRSLVDRGIKTNDRDSFRIARQLIRQEGLLVGGSSGSAVWAAMQLARDLTPGQRIVTILPDSVRNYMTKFLDDRWMRENGFMEPDWAVGTIGDVLRALPPKEVMTIELSEALGQAIRVFKSKGISQLPVTDNGLLAGIITEADVLHVVVEGRASNDSAIAEVMERNVTTLPTHANAAVLPEMFERGEVAIIVDDDKRVVGILTKVDLIDYLTRVTGR